MKRDAEDPLLDVLLSEVLGEHKPPDLSGQILAALQAGEARGGVSRIGETATDPAAEDPTSRAVARAADDGNATSGVPSTGDGNFWAALGQWESTRERGLAESDAAGWSRIEVARAGQREAARPGTSQKSRPREQTRLPGHSWAAFLVAAVLLVATGYGGWVWLRGEFDGDRREMADARGDAQGQRTGSKATQPPRDPAGAVAGSGPDVAAGDSEAAPAEPSPRTSVELPGPQFGSHSAPRDLDAALLAEQSELASPPQFAPPPPRRGEREIVLGIDSALQRYWAELGIEPTRPVAVEEYESRLGDLLGVPVALNADRALEDLLVAVGQPQAQLTLADRFTEAMLGTVGRSRVSPQQRSALAELLAPAFGGQKRFDELAAEMVVATGSTDPAAADFNPAAVWFGALAGPQSLPLTEQFAHVMLDLDLRCARCHDHPLDARVWQDQYWSLTAIFATGLRWTADPQDGLQVNTADGLADEELPVVFYELADGRQRMARPRLPIAWFGGEQTATAGPDTATELAPAAGSAGLRWMAAALRGNPQLARSIVNQMWEVVYGAPLVGSPANPADAPESPALLALQQELAEQFRAYDFDLGRLAAWVAAARPMWSEVPDTFLSPQFEAASGEQLAAAQRTVGAFAGFPHSVPRQSFSELLAIAAPDLTRDGTVPAELDAIGSRSLLAQIGGSAAPSGSTVEAGPRPPVARELLNASLEVAATAETSRLPVDWLQRVGGDYAFQKRVEHLYYLGGYWSPSGSQLEAARLLRSGVQDDAEALRRLWWVLSHQR